MTGTILVNSLEDEVEVEGELSQEFHDRLVEITNEIYGTDWSSVVITITNPRRRQ